MWAVGETIGFPIPTNIDQGRIQVIDVSSYNGRINWRKVKDQKNQSRNAPDRYRDEQ